MTQEELVLVARNQRYARCSDVMGCAVVAVNMRKVSFSQRISFITLFENKEHDRAIQKKMLVASDQTASIFASSCYRRLQTSTYLATTKSRLIRDRRLRYLDT